MTKFWITILFTFIFWFYDYKFAFCGIISNQNNNIERSFEIPPIASDTPKSFHSQNTSSSPKDPTEFSWMHIKPMDCEEYLQMGYKISGIYKIWPRNKIINGNVIEVFCDMETDKGGWTVIQRRGSFLRAKDYFFKDWISYKNGFGDIEKDFWLGNDYIFALTNQRLYSVRFDLIDVKGIHLYALYDVFYIEDEENKYKLTIQDYSGTANDSMLGHNDQKFSTKDQDNDSNAASSCATVYKGGWWYNSCHVSNLNGLYLRGKHESFADGVIWKHWKGYHESLDKVEIKIRPKQFRKNLIKLSH